MDIQLPLHLAKLPALGPKSINALSDNHITTLAQLLLHLPLRYRLKNKLSTVSDFDEESYFYVEALVIGLEPRRNMMRLRVQDLQGEVFSIVFFNFSSWHQQKYSIGVRLRIWGQAHCFQGRWEMSHPELEVCGRGEGFTPSIECVYPKIGKITAKALKKAFTGFWQGLTTGTKYDQVLESLRVLHAIDLTAQECCGFEDLSQKAKDKLAYLEALHYFSFLHEKEDHIRQKGVQLSPGKLFKELQNSFPFELTAGQQEVLGEILASYNKGDLQPRLLQGDVGSGKTIIGFLAMCCAFDAGEQAALMAPTELLARQHYENLVKLLPNYDSQILYLSGSLPAKSKKNIYKLLNEQSPLIVIGTHALFQESVQFDSLRVLVIDEQQRFGVDQRAKLLEKSKLSQAYQLTLSATPIPRTLAMATYGPIHLNVLKEKPKGRQDIKTYTLPADQIDIVYKSVRNCVAKNQQCYWVCPLIQESEHVQARDVEQAYARLTSQLSDLNIQLIHGQVPIDQREKVLTEFKQGKIDVLVSTLVIEVGVDSPTASLIVIESPDRLGLSQLHQLRGRVGRGQLQGHCILVYDTQLSSQSVQRLKALCESQDGFYLSEVDLQLRGPGEALGTRQTGQAQFRFFDIVKDEDKIPVILDQCRTISSQQLEILEVFFGTCDTVPYV